MSIGSILALALGLAMDSAAVSAARGLATPHVLPRHVMLVAVFFGGFQALMPLLGWAIGSRVGPAVEAWSHWIAFVLLAALGLKMLSESRGAGGADGGRATGDPFAMKAMFVLAVATSVDAFAVGVTLPMLNAPFALSLAVIGITTAILSVAGLFAGRYFGSVLGKGLDAAGGLVLIGLGTKILIEHLTGT